MKSAYGILLMLALASCSIETRLSNSVAKVDRYKKALGVHPCNCSEETIKLGGTTSTTGWAPTWQDHIFLPNIKFDTTKLINWAQVPNIILL